MALSYLIMLVGACISLIALWLAVEAVLALDEAGNR